MARSDHWRWVSTPPSGTWPCRDNCGKLDSYDFLLLDDLGYLPQGAEESEVLFTLIANATSAGPWA